MRARILPLLLAWLAAGCVRIEGGAVEVSWVIRTPDGRAITDCGCTSADPSSVEAVHIDRVRLNLLGQGGDVQGLTPCAGRAECEFACRRQTGVTPFDIPPGRSVAGAEPPRYAVWLTALDAAGNELPGVRTPERILRTVSWGQTTDMGAQLLETACDPECTVNNQGICTRP